ncbi:MAG: hypothetical protein AAGD07_04395 [Planctomycetota bacterium]
MQVSLPEYHDRSTVGAVCVMISVVVGVGRQESHRANSDGETDDGAKHGDGLLWFGLIGKVSRVAAAAIENPSQ